MRGFLRLISMTRIANRRLMAKAQKGFKQDISQAFAQLGTNMRGVLLRYADNEGAIAIKQTGNIQRDLGNMLTRFFVGQDGRNAFGGDGYTPLAEYPRILNKWLAQTVADQVAAHYKWMKGYVPEDVFNWLTSVSSRDVPVLVSEMTLSNEEVEALRIFHPNPLAEYEPAHTWVDPRGYRLSDRIWANSVETRKKLDLFLANKIREGKGAFEITKELEQFLNPSRRPLRTKQPYGRDASFDAMRLARTEIARAANQAAFISAYLNPYVDKIEVVRSPNGDPKCTICPQHATIGIGGERLRPPYNVNSAYFGPYHVFCMCRVESVVTDNPQAVTQRLRALMEEQGELPKPFMTPAQPQGFLRRLLGGVLINSVMGYIRNLLSL